MQQHLARLRRTSLFSLVGLAWLCSAGNVQATAVAEGTATIDWSTFTVTGDVLFASDSLFSATDAVVFDTGSFDNNFDTSADWGSTAVSVPVGDSIGAGSTTSSALNAQSTAMASGLGAIAQADVFTNRGGVFTASSDGTVTFEVDYQLSVNAQTDLSGESAFVNMAALVQLSQYLTPCCLGGDFGVLTDTLTDGNDWVTSTMGTLSVSAFFARDQQGYLVYETFANNIAFVVSEPATTAVLTLGLLGAGYARRRRAH